MANKQIKCILITGVAGFIGSNLTETLLESYKVIGIDDLSNGKISNMFSFINNPNFTFIQSKIQDYENLYELVQSADLVIHLAASVGILQTFNNPDYTLKNNISSTECIVDSCFNAKVPLIFASTSEVYGNQSETELKEDDKSVFDNVMSIRMSYSVSKIFDEMRIFLLKDLGFQCVVLRLFNVVGPNQCGEIGMVMPKFIKQALKGENLTVFGDGQQIRTFCDIRDIVAGIEKIIERNNFDYNIYNLGGKNSISIENLADTIIKLTNSTSKKVYLSYQEIHKDFTEIYYRKPCTDKFKKEFNWTNDLDIEESIKYILCKDYDS